MFKMRILFEKNDEAAYISHLDLMKVLQRGFCRAKLPVKYSEGFNPHICMSILSPLSTGFRSKYELCDLELTCDSLPDKTAESLNAVLPRGIRVSKCYPASNGLAVAKISSSVFEIYMEGGKAEQIADLFTQPVIFEKKSKRGSKEVNMLDYIKAISFESAENGTVCRCTLAAGDDPLNPSYLVTVLRERGLLSEDGTVKYTRTGILSDKGEIFC